MAKPDFPTWMKFSLVVLAILAIGVGWGVGYSALATNVGSNTTGIATNAVNHKTQADKNEKYERAMTERVHKIELNSKDIEAIATQGVEALTSINVELQAIRKEQSKSATIMAVNSVKLESLTKD